MRFAPSSLTRRLGLFERVLHRRRPAVGGRERRGHRGPGVAPQVGRGLGRDVVAGARRGPVEPDRGAEPVIGRGLRVGSSAGAGPRTPASWRPTLALG